MSFEKIDGGLENVPGFKFSSIKCGIKYDNRLDYTIIVSDNFCNAAGMFTKNNVVAAPVKLCRKRIDNKVKAILINSTNANACTGDEGLKNAATLTKDIAEKLSVSEQNVLMSSTGIIGHQLPVEKMINSHKNIIDNLSQNEGVNLPKAIMTTDTYSKALSIKFQTSIGEFILAGTAKGSGMIAPNMATMLSYIITDVSVNKENLNELFKRCVNKTLNAITIDGDTSTNDTAIILSPDNNKKISSSEDLKIFEEALMFILMSLSEMLIDDGEGTTKAIKVFVQNCKTEEDAKKIATSISNSLLVKTAFFGKDPNWGRIACAVGYSDVPILEDKLSIRFEDIYLLKNGTPVEYDEIKMGKILDKKNISIFINIETGNENFMMMTSDLSYEYVKINAEYTT